MSAIKVRKTLTVGGTEGLCDWDEAHGRGPMVACHILFLDLGGGYRGFTSHEFIKLDICNFLYLYVFFTIKW